MSVSSFDHLSSLLLGLLSSAVNVASESDKSEEGDDHESKESSFKVSFFFLFSLGNRCGRLLGSWEGNSRALYILNILFINLLNFSPVSSHVKSGNSGKLCLELVNMPLSNGVNS
jgi:hypothetical protein